MECLLCLIEAISVLILHVILLGNTVFVLGVEEPVVGVVKDVFKGTFVCQHSLLFAWRRFSLMH